MSPQLTLATHCPVDGLHEEPFPHPGGHMPPHPSSPQLLPAQLGVQHCAWKQVLPPVHAQSCAQLLQFSPVWQPLTPQATTVAQLPVASQVCPFPHCPHTLPHPSSPHCLPEHCGEQQPPATVHS